MGKGLIRIPLRWPKQVVALTALITVGFLFQFPGIRIDTDPENMLPASEPARVFHAELKETFNLRDFLVLGIVRDEGMFEPAVLERVAAITEEILEIEGVVADDVLAPTEVDDIRAEADGTLRISRLLDEIPETREDAEALLERVRLNPMLRGKLAGDDGKTIALFIPLTNKNVSYEVSGEISAIVERLGGAEDYYLAGQPVAQDTFGAEMFQQMAISAPLAGVVLFLLMLFFFRSLRAVTTAILVAIASVIWGMGALIAAGHPVHIMSSMIPIFLIPIAILPSIHILSEMYDRRASCESTKEAVEQALHHLFKPVLFTTVTTLVGFGSLILTPIPPVQVFGAFVAVGILSAWLLSMTFLPAMVMLESHRGAEKVAARTAATGGLAHHLQTVRRFAIGRRWIILAASVALLAFSVVGLLQIEVNDNPVRWFKKSHPLRIADRVLNDHLAGTYLAYLQLGGDNADRIKDPEVMTYIKSLQDHLETHPNVGATTSVADVIEKINYELHGEDPAWSIVPNDRDTIAQYLFLYEMSGGTPDDLFHFITPDAAKANVWIQMRAGENSSVQSVLDAAGTYMDENPLPLGIEAGWAGLSYVNVVWQDRMVRGMSKALLGSFVTVFLMMTFLFRSPLWGLVSMLPLTGTIALIYGMLGWTGRDFDMPVAVLSSLTLGLSIDFAIHFIQRSREIHRETGDFEETMARTFGGTGRAIFRNVMVLAIGFVPMFFANLTPYITVGLFFFLIMIVSGVVTMLLLPAITALKPSLFYTQDSGGRKMTGKLATTTTLGAILAAALLVSPVAATEMDATEIMKQAHMKLYYAGDDGTAEVHMSLVDKKGRERVREFTMLRWDAEDGGEQRYYTYFNMPADVRRTTFMVIKHVDKDDDRWIYVPAVDLVRRISANDKNSSFVGSDFSYEDVSGRHWEDDTHELLREDELDGAPVYVVKSVPTDGSNWAYRVSFVDREKMISRREEYFDKKEKLVRVFTADKIEMIDSHPTVTVRTMEDKKRDHRTTVTFNEVKYDVGIGPDIFVERYLKNPPRDFIQ